MQFIIFLFTILSFTCCLAQTSPMKYFYKDRKKETIPDFAALAVLEKQNCPLDIKVKEQICTSRYKIIRILDATPDTLKKEYIEVNDKPVLPYFRHRPMLVFGKYKNKHLQIEEYEEVREYFGDFHCDGKNCIGDQSSKFSPFILLSGDIYAFHSIGTPYYNNNIKNLDSVDILFYKEYLIPHLKRKVEVAGKDFSELLLRLMYNREPVKATKIKNGFAALGVVKSIRPASDSKQANLYELRVQIETVFKNNAKIDSNIAIFIDKNRLPSSWGCQPLYYYSSSEIPFYFFGDLKGSRLFIDSLASTLDAFVFGDTLYDISMGFSLEKLFAYFLPPNISIEEFKFAKLMDYFYFSKILYGRSFKFIDSLPECLRNNTIEIATKWVDFFDNYYEREPKEEKIKFKWPFVDLPVLHESDKFRCRTPFLAGQPRCYQSKSDLKGEGVWGSYGF